MSTFQRFPSRRSGGDDWFMQAPLLTSLLCLVCTLVSVGSFIANGTQGAVLPKFADMGALDQEQVWDGHYATLLTTVFLHANVLHLLFNMVWLFQLGRVLERSLNTPAYALFLVTAAVVSSCCELIFGSVGIGASGVVYALFGLMWAGRGRYPEWGGYANPANLRLFIGWGLFCLAATLLHVMQIGNAAHAGGFLFGLSVGWFFLSHRPLRWLWAVPLAGLLAVTTLSVAWMPWSGDWCFWKAGREYARGRFAPAIAWSQRSARLGVDPADNWSNIALAWQALEAQDTQRHDMAAAGHDAREAQAATRNAGPGTDDTP